MYSKRTAAVRPPRLKASRKIREHSTVGFTSLSIAFLPFKYYCPFDSLGVCKQLRDTEGNAIYSPLEDFPNEDKRNIYKGRFCFRIFLFNFWAINIQLL